MSDLLQEVGTPRRQAAPSLGLRRRHQTDGSSGNASLYFVLVVLIPNNRKDGRVERSNPEPDKVVNGASHEADEPTNAKGSLEEDYGWLRTVVENSSEIVTVVDPDGTLRYASPAFGRVLGHDPEEAIGTMNVFDLVHPEDLA